MTTCERKIDNLTVGVMMDRVAKLKTDTKFLLNTFARVLNVSTTDVPATDVPAMTWRWTFGDKSIAETSSKKLINELTSDYVDRMECMKTQNEWLSTKFLKRCIQNEMS